jgi:hypothetical protein
MYADLYFDVEPSHEQQPRVAPDIAAVDDSFARKLFPVRAVPIILAVAVLALSPFSVNKERTEAVAHAPLPVAAANAIEPAARLSLPARAAMYRENFFAH